MNDTDVKDATIESLLEAYTRAAAANGKASRDADYETANRHYEIMATICRELKSRGRATQLHLLTLLKDSNPHVQIWAASHALEFAPEQAESTLEELSHPGGMIAFEARMTLGEWRKGVLRFP